MPRLTVNDVNIPYLNEGQGPVLLLLSGTLGTARRDFSAQFDPYATRIGWWCPTGRGYGAIPPADRHFPDNFYEREARDMAALARALDLREMTVFGWSEGAAVGRWLATVEPTRVKAVVVWGGIASRSMHPWVRRCVAASVAPRLFIKFTLRVALFRTA